MTLMTIVYTTHLGTTLASAEAGCSHSCSHGVRARVWEAPEAASTPDYSAHRQARPITVHAQCVGGEYSGILVPWSRVELLAHFSVDAHYCPAQYV